MNKLIAILIASIVFVLLTVITQIGGLVFLLGRLINRILSIEDTWKKLVVMVSIYVLSTFLIVPLLAGLFGRERIVNTQRIKPVNYMTVLLNRNYVRPELNNVLLNSEKTLKDTKIELRYLDASFPFMDGFPLLPHLSHHDGKKLDLSLIYENENGILTNLKKSISGYGSFEEPKSGETHQSDICKSKGYFQYDYPKYLTFGDINKDLSYSNRGMRLLLAAILENNRLGKIFIEPHLKNRLKIDDSRIAFHGCRAVRHDDHIHIQLN